MEQISLTDICSQYCSNLKSKYPRKSISRLDYWLDFDLTELGRQYFRTEVL